MIVSRKRGAFSHDTTLEYSRAKQNPYIYPRQFHLTFTLLQFIEVSRHNTVSYPFNGLSSLFSSNQRIGTSIKKGIDYYAFSFLSIVHRRTISNKMLFPLTDVFKPRQFLIQWFLSIISLSAVSSSSYSMDWMLHFHQIHPIMMHTASKWPWMITS